MNILPSIFLTTYISTFFSDFVPTVATHGRAWPTEHWTKHRSTGKTLEKGKCQSSRLQCRGQCSKQVACYSHLEQFPQLVPGPFS
jgi:hypothetical protein